MTNREKEIVSAYTGILMCDFCDYHSYVEKILGRAVFTHEFADSNVMDEIKNAAKNDFLNLCKDCITNDQSIKTIKEARKAAGLTQKAVSDLLGIPLRTIEDWEGGRRKPPEYVERLVKEKILNERKG